MRYVMGWVMVVVLAGAAGAQQPAPAAAAPPAEVVTEPKVKPELSSDTQDIAAESVRNAQLRLQLDNAKLLKALEDLGGYPSDAPSASSRPKTTVGRSSASIGAPELVGIRGARSRMRAEFVVGGALIRVGVGEYVTSEYRVAGIEAGGVVLEGLKGERERLFFGRPKPEGQGDRAPIIPSTIPAATVLPFPGSASPNGFQVQQQGAPDGSGS